MLKDGELHIQLQKAHKATKAMKTRISKTFSGDSPFACPLQGETWAAALKGGTCAACSAFVERPEIALPRNGCETNS